jgi:Na+-driven multidrug efflux pump
MTFFYRCFTENILLLTGQDPDIAALSARFTMFMIPGVFPYYMAESIKRFLQSQGIMSASLYVIMFVSPINLGLQYLLGMCWFRY